MYEMSWLPTCQITRYSVQEANRRKSDDLLDGFTINITTNRQTVRNVVDATCETWLDDFMTNEAALTEARNNVTNARNAYSALKVGSKAWRNAAEELDFWTGRVGHLAAR